MPEIILFFKNVDAERLSDPGPQLERVLNFQKEINAKKEIHLCISSYVQKKNSEDTRENADESQIRPTEDTARRNLSETKAESEPLFSAEGDRFLRGLIAKSEDHAGPEHFANVDVARLRLLASVIGSRGNDDQCLGVHDANILFVHRSDLDLSFGEQAGLIDSGLTHYSGANTPLWYWWQCLG